MSCGQYQGSLHLSNPHAHITMSTYLWRQPWDTTKSDTHKKRCLSSLCQFHLACYYTQWGHSFSKKKNEKNPTCKEPLVQEQSPGMPSYIKMKDLPGFRWRSQQRGVEPPCSQWRQHYCRHPVVLPTCSCTSYISIGGNCCQLRRSLWPIGQDTPGRQKTVPANTHCYSPTSGAASSPVNDQLILGASAVSVPSTPEEYYLTLKLVCQMSLTGFPRDRRLHITGVAYLCRNISTELELPCVLCNKMVSIMSQVTAAQQLAVNNTTRYLGNTSSWTSCSSIIVTSRRKQNIGRPKSHELCITQVRWNLHCSSLAMQFRSCNSAGD